MTQLLQSTAADNSQQACRKFSISPAWSSDPLCFSGPLILKEAAQELAGPFDTILNKIQTPKLPLFNVLLTHKAHQPLWKFLEHTFKTKVPNCNRARGCLSGQLCVAILISSWTAWRKPVIQPLSLDECHQLTESFRQSPTLTIVL